ncbi:hypothetical protein [Allobranchiibius huperziae]|uniref:Thymidine phosphorylase n=1 Tax=Allobranchiibius huperziae TaxID=1874116 RepID=A0A853DLQ8_9MICO|nr:hypothetical protein [Allobranchiibius huperziae]NYJ75934.1 hypothetical protein [Allobranchiibius huperziae]
MSDNDSRPPRRPALRSSGELEAYAGSSDPAQLSEAAHETAAALVGTGRAAHDPQVTAKLVNLVDELGISTLAELWADRPATSLPGALWRLYTLREWVRRDPVGAARDYEAGRGSAEVAHAVAGSAEPPTPEALQQLTDQILAGVFEGDLAVALERASAFCRVVSVGRAHRVDDQDSAASTQTTRAAALLTTASDLSRCAALWRAGKLD